MSDAPLTHEQRSLTVQAHGVVAEQADLLARQYQGLVTRAELVSFGHEGLVDAARRWDAERADAVDFRVFARFRVRGAMLNGIGATSRDRRFEAAVERAGLEHASQWSTDFDPFTDGPDDARRRLDRLGDEVCAHMLAALRTETIASAWAPAGEDEIAARHAHVHALRALADARAELPEEHEALLRIVYDEGHDLKGAAEALGLHYKAAQRQHGAVLGALAGKLRKRGVSGAEG